MFGEPMKTLIIVCDKKTVKYGNYLRQLITANDDEEDKIVGVKDGSVDVSVWDVAQYTANMATTSGKTYVLFIGKNKASKSEISTIPTKFCKFGMEYGWLGTRAKMIVGPAVSKNEYPDFLSFCQRYGKRFEKTVYKLSKQQVAAHPELGNKKGVDVPTGAVGAAAGTSAAVAATAGTGAAAGTSAAFGAVAGAAVVSAPIIAGVLGVAVAGVASVATGIVKSSISKEQINEQQYQALTSILYLDGLNTFLEGK